MVHIDESTRVAEVRRLAIALAESEGLGEQATGEVAIISTEIANNVLKHAKVGEVHVSGLSSTGQPGVEILAIDRGPGIENWHDCLADGFSTAGTSGTGLGAISRLADVFDAHSGRGQGTVVVARKVLPGSKPRHPNWTVGVVKAPYPGETMCGDNWSLRHYDGGIALMVADGLGHGVLAADASFAAVRAFQAGRVVSASALLEDVHLALRSTRGAAVAMLHIDGDGCARYAGLGNIAGVLLGGSRHQFMVSHNGTAGLEARRFQEFEYALPENATVVMHSDGLTTSWSTDSYPGLLRRHPSVIAGVLYRDATRGRDDVLVLVARHTRG